MPMDMYIDGTNTSLLWKKKIYIYF